MGIIDITNNFMKAIAHKTPMDFDLQSIDGFPYQEWKNQNEYYDECDRWFSGEILDETIDVEKKIQKYPVKINPIPSLVLKHTYTLFGECEEDERPLVIPKLVSPVPFKKGMTDKDADTGNYILNQVWWENSGRMQMIMGGLYAQIYGGCVFKLDYLPADPFLTTKLAVTSIHPRYFTGRPSSRNMFAMDDSWFVMPIPHSEALQYGVNIPSETTPWLIEHWTPTSFDVKINEFPAKHKNVMVDGKPVDMGGNPFGFVPVVYIPHERVLGFWGTNSFDNVKGIVKELNLRVADYGDAVAADSHSYLVMKNVNGTPNIIKIADGLPVINLGSSTNITGNEAEPALDAVNRDSASTPMQSLVDDLYKHYRRAAYMPGVADGEDEGSQRSGLTLAIRFWPLLSHANMERHNWTVGLNRLEKMMLLMLKEKGYEGVNDRMVQMMITQQWAPSLPRDREVIVNEVGVRATHNLGTIKHLMTMLGDIPDTDSEFADILVEQKELEAVKPKPATPFGNKQKPGSTPAATQKPTSEKPTKET